MFDRARRQELDEWNARRTGQAFEPDPHVRMNALKEAGYTPYSTRAQMERARYGLPDGVAPNFIGYAHGRDGRDGRRPRRRIKGYTADQYARQMDYRENVEREEMARFRASRRTGRAAPAGRPMTDARNQPATPVAEREETERQILARAAVEQARDRQRDQGNDNAVLQNVDRVSGRGTERLPKEMRDGTGQPFALAFRRGRIVGYGRRP